VARAIDDALKGAPASTPAAKKLPAKKSAAKKSVGNKRRTKPGPAKGKVRAKRPSQP
jgi:hypothetical protein